MQKWRQIELSRWICQPSKHQYILIEVSLLNSIIEERFDIGEPLIEAKFVIA